MKKRQYKFMLRNEIRRLNKRIDSKILMGYPYEHDAKRHKQLLATLTKVTKRERFLSAVNSVFGRRSVFAKIGFALF